MKSDRAYLSHILDALDRIARYTATGRDHFFSDERTQDAVVRNLEIIGEAAKKLSADARANASGIDWRVVAAMRDKLIHEYFGVNLEIVWRTVERDLPLLRSSANALLDRTES